MPIRRKAILTIAVVIAGLMAILYATTSSIFMTGFARVEEADTKENVARVLDAISDSIAKIDFTTRDWAGWDDTYDYIQDGNQTYVEENLSTDAIGTAGLELNLVIYLRLSGDIRFGAGFDLTEDKYMPLPEKMTNHLTLGSLLLTHSDERSNVKGILMLPSGPVLLASRPILTNEKKGPIRGTLIFGRYLDQAAVTRLAEITHLSLQLRRFDDPQLPDDFRTVRAAMASDDSTVVQPLSPQIVTGYALLKDIYGWPALILRVDIPRTIYQQGHTTAWYFLLALVGVGCGLGGVTLSLFDKLWLSRLARQASDQRYRDLFENAHDLVFTIDPAGNLTSVNRSGERVTGYGRDELLTMNIAQLVAPEHQETVRGMLAAAATVTDPTVLEIAVLSKDGRRISLEVSARLVTREEQPVGVQGIARDVTERKQAEAALRESQERYMLAARGANDGLWDWDLRTDTVYFSSRWKAMLGYTEDEIGTRPEEWFRRVHTDDVADLRTRLDAHLSGAAPSLESEYRMFHRDGSIRWMLCRGLAVREAAGAYRVAGSQTDITDRKRSEQQLLHDAFHDGLTGLPNRALFMDRLGQTMRRMARSQEVKFAVLFLDVDRFKVVNDSLGHLEGDRLLKEIARRLELTLRAGDTVARLGGDEFAILLDGVKEARDASDVTERIRNVLSMPFVLEGQEVSVTASIGIAPYAPEHERPEEYLRDADTAMYRAKELGRARFEVFTPEMHERAMARLQLENDLRRALESGELRVHYQPIVSFDAGEITGFEALARWYHPQRGLIPPAEFIPVAEETELIVLIGSWVLREACRQVRVWQEEFSRRSPLIVSVNVSARQLAHPEFVAQVQEVLTEAGLAPQSLNLEITESVIMRDLPSVSRTLAQLRALGVGVSVDDFGTGYSSLGVLPHYPVNLLKIDRSFVRNMHRTSEDAEIVHTILTLAHNLGLRVVAEGVETVEQLAGLRTLGCDLAQGYFFARPAASADVVSLLKTKPNWEFELHLASKSQIG